MSSLTPAFVLIPADPKFPEVYGETIINLALLGAVSWCEDHYSVRIDGAFFIISEYQKRMLWKGIKSLSDYIKSTELSNA